MSQDSSAFIELRDLQLHADIGTYGPNETKPNIHLLDLRLGIALNQVVISHDDMANVFDYDPLFMEIERLANGHYETQERLITLIATACAAYTAIQRIEITLKKSPVRLGGGSIGIQLSLDEIATNALRLDKTKTAE